MNTILIAILLLADAIKYLIILDVILSWLSVFGLNIRPKFLNEIINPIYSNIKKILPTSFGPIDFAPIVVLFILILIKGLVISFDPNIAEYYLEITKF